MSSGTVIATAVLLTPGVAIPVTVCVSSTTPSSSTVEAMMV